MEQLELTLGYDRPDIILPLFTEYTDMLVEGDPSFRGYLDIQHYEDELRDLRVKYGLPGGRLYLAWLNGDVVGCIALRRLDDEHMDAIFSEVVPPEGVGLAVMNRLGRAAAFRSVQAADVLASEERR